MTPDAFPPAPPPRTLSPTFRIGAGLLGGIFVGAFLLLGVRDPGDGWLGAIGCGVPMVWLIQAARTGCARSAISVAWFGLWYTIFSSGWRIALALERPLPGEALSGEAGLGVFLGSIALVGSANSLARYREQLRGARRRRPVAHSGSQVPC